MIRIILLAIATGLLLWRTIVMSKRSTKSLTKGHMNEYHINRGHMGTYGMFTLVFMITLIMAVLEYEGIIHTGL